MVKQNKKEGLGNMSSDKNQEFFEKYVKIKKKYLKSPNVEENAIKYLEILEDLAIQQEDGSALKDIADKADSVYKKHSESAYISCSYLLLLCRIAVRVGDEKELNTLYDRATIVYDKCSKTFGDKDLYVEIRKTGYIIISEIFAEKVGDIEKLREIAEKVFEVYDSYDKKESVANYYVEILVILIRKESDVTKLEENLKRFCDSLPFLSKKSVEMVVNLISKAISQLNQRIKNNIGDEGGLKHWICRIVDKSKDIDVIKNTNNGMVSNLLKQYKNDNIGVELILDIYSLVLNIKFELAVKEFPEGGLGHYTTARTLHIHLNQKENISNKSTYKIISKSRLYNVDYMNDPEEGKILDRYLLQQKENNFNNSLNPSPWFLMCLTTAIDDLTMWSQYGANAEGVFLELKNDSFRLVNSIDDLKWLSGRLDSKTYNNIANEKESNSDKDNLFKICYLDENELNNGNLVIVSSDNKKDFYLTEKEIENVTSLLEELKEKMDEIDTVKNSKLSSDIDKLLEEIRYLFKASGYQYEKELRVLRYAKIESTASELIGIQYDSDTLAKPYLESKDPIQIKRVIFGPKFSRPEYVTPLIRLVDKDIEFTTSERKFK